MKKIVIQSKKYGKHISIVDNDDYLRIKQMNWSLKKTGNKVYAHTNTGQRTFTMHRMIMGFPSKKKQIDHRNFNGLDNRKVNLRLCINAENARHRRTPSNNTTGYKGVSWRKDVKKYSAQITINYKQVHLGYFASKEQAASVYNTAALKYFGEFAKLNQL